MDGLDIPFEIPLLAESSSHDTMITISFRILRLGEP